MDRENTLPLLRFVLSVSLTIAATFAAPVQKTTQAEVRVVFFLYILFPNRIILAQCFVEYMKM